jgi:ribosome-binding factor A
MVSRRQRKVADLLHEEISQLIQFQTQDPRLGFVTITGVDVSPDLREARVYFTILDNDDAGIKETLAGLNSAAPYFKHQMSQTLSLRHIPNLAFQYDTSLENALRIDRLLDSIKNEYPPTTKEENSAEADDTA